MALNPNKGLLCYTDGSYSNGGPGGYGWVAVDAYGGQQEASGFLPPPTTVNRMELTAVYAALEELNAEYGACEIEVVSDSQYVVLGCQYPERKRNVNIDLWDRVDAAIASHNWVQFRHVRGHIGIKLNELADALAVKARREARFNV